MIKSGLIAKTLHAKPIDTRFKKIQPKFANVFFLSVDQGVPKSKLNVPFADVTKLSDSVLFTDPANAAKNYFVPVYEIEVHRISGKQQLRIDLKESTEGEGGTLQVMLKTGVPDTLENRLNGATEMDHQKEVNLVYTVPGTGIEKRLPFTEILKTETGIDATLRISSFQEFSQICTAISDSEYGCKLEVHRSIKAAIPKYSGNTNSENNKPILHFTKKEASVVRGRRFTRIYLSIRNWDSFPNGLFRKSPELPPCGQNRNASRTWLNIYNPEGQRLYGYCGFSSNENLQNFSFAIRAGQAIPSACYVELIDRKLNKKYISNQVNLSGQPSSDPLQPGEKIYTVLNHKLTQSQPFHFLESQHPYIFRNTGDRDTVIGGYKPFHIEWSEDGSEHVYLQEEVNPTKFLYLPDIYKISREADPPFSPRFTVTMVGRKLDDLKAEISYQLEAVANPRRLEDAFSRLKQNPEVGDKEITFHPLILPSKHLEYKLSLPESSGFQSRPDSLLTLEGIQDALPPISLQSFESMFDTITDPDSVSNLLTGHVEADLPGISIPPLPVSIRLGEADETMLGLDLMKNSIFRIEVRNVTSQTLSAQGVVITIQDGANTFTGSKAGLTLPLKLSAGESAMFTVIPDVEIEKPEHAIVALTWEGMQQHLEDGSTTPTAGSFSIVNQKIGEADTIGVTNLMESIITFDSVDGFVQSRGKEIPLILKNLSFPVEVRPGESFSFDAIPSENVESYTLEDLSFDWRGLQATPDKGRLYDAIVDTTVSATYESTLNVSFFINPISGDSDIRLLKIEFRNQEDGPLIEELIVTEPDFSGLESDVLKKEVMLPLPIRDFILGAESTGRYWYRIILIKKTDGSGDSAESAPVIGEWQSKTGSLEITSSLLPN